MEDACPIMVTYTVASIKWDYLFSEELLISDRQMMGKQFGKFNKSITTREGRYNS